MSLEQLERRRMLASAFASVTGGLLSINGTSGPDLISVTSSAGNIIATRGAESISFASSTVQRISVTAGAGDDSIVSSVALPATLLGEDGNDSLKGGSANDSLNGGAGNDTLN